MCGRLFQTLPLHRLLQIARVKKCTNQEQHTSSYNVCPTTYIPVIKPNRFYIDSKPQESINDQQLSKQQSKQLTYMKWGHKSQYNMIVNGRVQELMNKRMFVNIIKNRCIVIMEGYYQWNGKKEPFSLRPKDGDHFLVAGLYTDENQIIILTKDAIPQLSQVHHRMPVILSHQEINVWLNPKNTRDIQNIINKSLLKKEKQVWKNIGFAKLAPHVSNIKQKSAKCLMTYDQYKKELDKTGLMRFWKKAPAIQVIEVKKSLQDQVNKETISEPKENQNIIKLKETQSNIKGQQGAQVKQVMGQKEYDKNQ